MEHALQVPEAAVKDAAVRSAVSKAASGGKPFGLLAIGKADAKRMVASIRLAGSPPKAPSDWSLVNDYLDWRDAIDEFRNRWTAARADYDLPDLPESPDELAKKLKEIVGQFQLAIAVADEHAPEIFRELPELFP